jgi:four helix bundle protein
MADITSYRDLETWQTAMTLVDQLRRASISIPSNVAEGHSRRSTKAYASHVSIALGSHGELETCVEIAARLGFLPQDAKMPLVELCDSVGRLLNGLHRSLARKLSATGR